MDDTAATTKSTMAGVSASMSSRFEGLIDTPLILKVKASFVSLLSYLDNFGPIMSFLYVAVSMFRLFQLVGPSFYANHPLVWNTQELPGQAMSVISVLYHFCPVQSRMNAEISLLYSYIGITTFYLVYMTISAIVYKKTTKVTAFSTYFLTILISIFTYFLHPSAVEVAGELISHMIKKKQPANAANVVAVVLSLILVLVSFFFTSSVYSSSLSFRPCSLQTIEPHPQNALFAITLVATFITSLVTDFGKIAIAVAAAISIVAYNYIYYTFRNYASHINQLEHKLVLGFAVGAQLNFLLYIIVVLEDIKRNEIIIIISFALIVLSTLFAHYYCYRQNINELIELDFFADNTQEKVLSSPAHYKRLLRAGFMDGHPAVINFSLQNEANKLWPSDTSILILSAKFAAIYPENNRIVFAASRSLASSRSGLGIIETILSDITILSKMRETTLTPDLKGKLGKIAKLNMKARSKLRNIWDLILQGNINDMESSIRSAYSSVSDLDADLHHLSMNYPNNRFVARTFARYYKDICANNELYKKWTSNMQILQKGGLVNQDRIHELGIRAFPMLPENVEFAKENINYASDTDTEEFMSEDDNGNEQTGVLSNMVNEYRPPSILVMFFGSVISYFIIIFIPIVLFMSLFSGFITSIKAPSTILYGTAYTRTGINILAAFISFHALVTVPDPNSVSNKIMDEVPMPPNFLLESFGGNRDHLSILEYSLKRIGVIASFMTQINDYMPDDEDIKKAKDFIFLQTTPWYFYENSTHFSVDYMSASEISSRYAHQITKALAIENPNASTLSESVYLTVLNNYGPAADSLTKAMGILNAHIIDLSERSNQVFQIIMIVYIIVIVLVYSVVCYYQMKSLRKNKRKVFKIFTVLPKAVIPSVAASFYALKAHSNSEISSEVSSSDLNKQEENIVKVFASLSDGSGSTSIPILYSTITFMIILCGCISTYLSCSTYQLANTEFIQSAPHIDYLFGSSSAMFKAFAIVIKLTLYGYHDDFRQLIANATKEIETVRESINNNVNYFHQMRFGIDGNPPYSGIDKSLSHSQSIIICHNSTNPPETLGESTECFNSELQMYLFISLMKKLSGPMLSGNFPHPVEDEMAETWILSVLLYDTFFYPTARDIVTTIGNKLEAQKGPLIIQGVCLIIISFIFLLVTIYIGYSEQVYFRFTLRQLLHCPAQAITSSNAIMSFLSGSRSNRSEEHTSRDNQFYTAVMNKINDIVIVINVEKNEIISVNDTFIKFFEIERENIIGTNVKNFFDPSRFEGEVNNALKNSVLLTFKKKINEIKYISFKSVVVGVNRIINGKDETMRKMHEQLIADEKKKSDAMLSSILPASLVPRVQKGERNISFAVQSVSVLFLDIVEFTPWCSSHPAAYVMKMLNIIFKEMDAIVATYNTLTKVKCIGDCYMCAGGIFDEINQPAVHAKEMVEFGRKAILKILELDEIHNEKLRIRVGINTGGPIVAGVLGTEKPTFEILGPVINIAQQMEHHGVPMEVHVSRNVYELIYGSSFEIKERGEIAVKNGKMSTYLISPK